ncbi:Nrap protein [Gautieria morchelliformis]|nr:Nrap protein [Gautieria morchelliformis]
MVQYGKDGVGDQGHAEKHSSKLPSASELRAINEARTLHKSNTFKAQLDLMLSTVRPNKSRIPALERTLQKLYTHLTSLPSISPVHPLEAPDALPSLISHNKQGRHSTPVSSSIAIPYPLPIPPQSTAWKVAFEPPEIINVMGSWPNNFSVRKPDGTPFSVDLVVEMPAGLFQEKDSRNSRFFYKRAFFLACLATSLAHSLFNFTVEYEAAEGDVRLTTVLLSSCKDGADHDFSNLNAAIRIIPVLSDNAPIPLQRLSPAQSNVRGISTLPGAPSQQEGEQSHVESHPPTAHYNNSLALSFARPSRAKLIGANKLLDIAPSFRDGLALLRVWASQRGFGAGFTPGRGNGARNYCVRGFEGLGAWWACLLEVLILGEEPAEEMEGSKSDKTEQRRSVGRGLSPYQLFRAALDFLARHDFQNEPVFMKVVENGQKFETAEWKAHYDAVFVDSTGTVNMLAGVPGCSLQLLRYDAANTLRQLNASDDPFSQVFLTDAREPHARFDTVIRINLANTRHYTSLEFPSTQMATLHSLVSTVRKALNTRAQVVVPLQPRSMPRPISTAQPTPLPTLTLGIIFDPTHAFRLVDHGPPASSAGVDAYRTFWGAKAELRRFKDGAIVESCVWDEGIVRVEDREGIPAQIVRYILNLHFGVPEGDVCILGGDLRDTVSAPAVRGRGESGYKNALAAFDKLTKKLKALQDDGHLPLMLVSTKPCSPYLRYTSVLPPSPIPSSSKSVHPTTSHLPAFEVALQFERSSKWPDDLRAIQKVKLALFESIARGLSQGDDISQACVVIDKNTSEIEDACALEVVLDGWAFHARVGHDREITLLQNMLEIGSKRPDQPTLPAQEREAATHSLHVYRKRFIHGPAHHTTVLALHHKWSAFSYTARLVKRWFGAHWLSARVTDEAIELICAQVFLFHDNDVPACGKRGFVRAMNFLTSWDGYAYVPLYEAVRENNAAVTPEHSIAAGQGSWRLATLENSSGTMWCENVTVPVANRIRDLAKATVLYLVEGAQTFKPLFEPHTSGYDFLIELDLYAVSRYWQSMRATPSVWNPAGYVNIASSADDGSPVRVDFNPAEMFFQDLQTAYGDVMELFYDVYGGTTIGGVWNPSVVRSEQHPWGVLLGFSSLPLAQQKKQKPGVSFNAEGVLSEIRRIGQGIVKSITTRS